MTPTGIYDYGNPVFSFVDQDFSSSYERVG